MPIFCTNGDLETSRTEDKEEMMSPDFDRVLLINPNPDVLVETTSPLLVTLGSEGRCVAEKEHATFFFLTDISQPQILIFPRAALLLHLLPFSLCLLI